MGEKLESCTFQSFTYNVRMKGINENANPRAKIATDKISSTLLDKLTAKYGNKLQGLKINTEVSELSYFPKAKYFNRTIGLSVTLSGLFENSSYIHGYYRSIGEILDSYFTDFKVCDFVTNDPDNGYDDFILQFTYKKSVIDATKLNKDSINSFLKYAFSDVFVRGIDKYKSTEKTDTLIGILADRISCGFNMRVGLDDKAEYSNAFTLKVDKCMYPDIDAKALAHIFNEFVMNNKTSKLTDPVYAEEFKSYTVKYGDQLSISIRNMKDLP